MTTLLRHFDRSRFDLALAVIDMRGAVFDTDLPRDVKLIELGRSRLRFALVRLVRVVWSVRPDVIFSTLGHLNLTLAILRPLLPRGVKLIGRETVVVSKGLSEYRKPHVWRSLYRIFCKRLDHLVCQSRDMRDDLASNFDVPIEQMTVVPNPVDLDFIRYQAGRRPDDGIAQGMLPPDAIRLIAAGRLVPQKGFDLLIEAIALCRDRRILVSVLGQGPLENALKDMVRSFGLTAQISFLGFRKNPYPLFSAANALVISSRYEGFPNVALESLACGTPVIATPAPGGTRELLEGIHSCEVAAAVSAPALADAICRWITRRPPRVGPEVMEPFSVHRIARAYERKILRVASTA